MTHAVKPHLRMFLLCFFLCSVSIVSFSVVIAFCFWDLVQYIGCERERNQG